MDPLLILKTCALFSGLDEAQLKGLAALGTLRAFPKNRELIAIQEQVDEFGVILSGRVHILQMFVNGSFSLMDSLHPGYVLGMDLACTKTRRSPYCAVAAEPGQVLMFTDGILLEPGALPEDTRMAVWRNLLTMLSQENMRKHNRLAILAQRGLRDRILTYLAIQYTRKDAACFKIPFSRNELADFLCVNRSALSHELSRMAADGLIRFRKNQFTLLPEGLRQSNWTVQ